MLSATNEGGGRVDMRGNQMAPPNAAKPSTGGAYGGGGGRKLRTGDTNENKRPMSNGTDVEEESDGKNEGVKKSKRRAPKTMEELDRRIEEDELALVNMKREIREQQKVEIANSQKTLIGVKKQYDVVHAQNKVLDKKLADLMDKMNGYKAVDDAMQESSQETQSICRELTRKLANIEEMVNAEQRTLDMQRLMRRRLESDTGTLKLENGELTYKLDKVKYDLNSCMSTLQLSKVELAEKEKILEEMHAQAMVRSKDRARRVELLHGIMSEGSNNLTMIQEAIHEEGKLHSPVGGGKEGTDEYDLSLDLASSALRPPSSPSRGAASDGDNSGSGKKERWAGPRDSPGGGGKRGGNGYGASSASSQELDDEPEDSPRKMAARMNLDQIEDVINRYRTRAFRMEKLEVLEQDLKTNIQMQNSKALTLSNKLEECRVKTEQLASARQIYQEVDHKNSALSGARKMHDEYKEKEYNMRVNLDALKRAIPRLVAKMTKNTPISVPSDVELADALHKLSAELLKYIKEIQQAVSKDYSPEEQALMQARQHADQQRNLSELDKLVNMPGFNRMQTEIYFNMMGARPDLSANNVRIYSEIERQKRIAAQEGEQAGADDSKDVPRLSSLTSFTEAPTSGSSPASKAERFKAEVEARKSGVVAKVRKSLHEGVDVIASAAHHSDESGEKTENGGKATKHTHSHTHTQGGGAHKAGAGNGAKPRGSAVGTDHTSLIPEPPVIDRSTAKAISMLVLERDGKGVIPEKPKPKPKKKAAYKQR